MTAIDLLAPEIAVNGQALQDAVRDALMEARVELSLCLVGRTTLRFRDADFTISSAGLFKIGGNVAVTVKGKKVFSGLVTGVSLDQVGGDLPELTVIADDNAVVLGHGTVVRNFANVSASEAIAQAMKGVALPIDVDSTTEVMEYVLEAGTPMAFLNKMCERNGLVWWCDEKLHVKKIGTSTATVNTELGEDLLEFSVRASGLRPVSVQVTGWDPDKAEGVIGNHDATSASGSEFVNEYLGNRPKTLVNAKLNSAEWSPHTQNEAEGIAKSLYEEASAGAVIARGTMFANAALKPATTVSVKNAGPASGGYLVTEVVHLYNTRGFTTRFVAGPHRPVGLVDTLGREEPDVSFSLAMLVPAVVTNNKDDTNPGRVKVKFVHAPKHEGKDLESAWARIVTLGGGNNRGMVFLPEVNDEVLVGFENGDPRRPVVLGGLFSTHSKMPEADKLLKETKVEKRQITSRNGHVLEISDGSSDKEAHLLFKLAGGAEAIRIGQDRMDLKMPQGKPFAITVGTASIEISGQGDITIKGNSIALKAQTTLTAEAQATAELKATASMTVQGATTTVKGTGSTSVEAGGTTTIKGAMVVIN